MAAAFWLVCTVHVELCTSSHSRTVSLCVRVAFGLFCSLDRYLLNNITPIKAHLSPVCPSADLQSQIVHVTVYVCVVYDQYNLIVFKLSVSIVSLSLSLGFFPRYDCLKFKKASMFCQCFKLDHSL